MTKAYFKCQWKSGVRFSQQEVKLFNSRTDELLWIYFKHKTGFKGSSAVIHYSLRTKIHFSFGAACSCFLKYTHRSSEHLLCADRQMFVHSLCLASEDRLTAAATLAVGLPSRQQHLQAVPKHDCSRCSGLHYRKICWGKKRQ